MFPSRQHLVLLNRAPLCFVDCVSDRLRAGSGKSLESVATMMVNKTMLQENPRRGVPMLDRPIDDRLHLPSLRIEGLRGVKSLEISKLGRVTLLVGRNGTGKTTVLDAARIFAERGHVSSLLSVLRRNEEYERSAGHRDDIENIGDAPSFEALFHGRRGDHGDSFRVGPAISEAPRLAVEVCSAASLPEEWTKRFGSPLIDNEDRVIKTVFGDHQEYLPVFDNELDTRRLGLFRRLRFDENGKPDHVSAQQLGPGLMGSRDLDRLWGEIALTKTEELALQALNLATLQPIEGVAMIPSDHQSRRVLVKLRGGDRVPLRSLGDGATRLFGLAVALANSVDGFLLIDEAENGVHHTLQHQYWDLIMRAAEEHNVQVIATTHSWDCIRGFASAAVENPDVDGIAVRLEPRDGGHRAVEYSEEELATASAQGIEVR